MTHSFDKDYWDTHWERAGEHAPDRRPLANPYLARETADLTPGTALDAGCGEGAEAIWLAVTGWQVTAADISAAALERARQRASTGELAGGIDWVDADLTTWEPDRRYDLVMTHYAHPAMPQLDFYERIAEWVTPGGTLLIVGHLHDHGEHDHGEHHDGHDHQHPEEATATAEAIVARLEPAAWSIVTADETTRQLRGGGRVVQLRDVVVRAERQG